jgi:hypothetical protein
MLLSSNSLRSLAFAAMTFLPLAVPARSQEREEPQSRKSVAGLAGSDGAVHLHKGVADSLEELRKAAAQLKYPGATSEADISAKMMVLVSATDRVTLEISKCQRLSPADWTNVRKAMEDTLLNPSIIIGCVPDHQIHQLYPSIVQLYTAILPKLIRAPSDESEAAALHSERRLHYAHICELLWIAKGHSFESLANLLFANYCNSGLVPEWLVYADVSNQSRQDGALVSPILVRHFDRIRDSFRDQLARLETNDDLNDLPSYHLLMLHIAIRQGLNHPDTAKALTPERLGRCQQDLREIFVADLVPHVVDVWLQAYQSIERRGRAGSRSVVYGRSMSQESLGLHRDDLGMLVGSLLAEWPGDRHELGTIFFDGIDKLRKQGCDPQVFTYMAVNMLPLLAPHPDRKAFLIDELRSGLVPGTQSRYLGVTLDRPTQVARILGLCLLSDHLFFASKGNTDFNSKLSIELITNLRSVSRDLKRYDALLTPAQSLLVELMRAAKGGEVALVESGNWPKGTGLVGVSSSRARQVLGAFVTDLYSYQPRGLVPGEAYKLGALLPTPASWGLGPVYPPYPGASDSWTNSFIDLLTYGDSVIACIAEDLPKTLSVDLLSEHLALVTKLMVLRGGLLDRRSAAIPCEAVSIVRGLYQKPRLEVFGRQSGDAQIAPTPFEQLARSISRQRSPNMSEKRAGENFAKRDEQARQYVEVLQRLCIVRFVIEDLNNFANGSSGPAGPFIRRLSPLLEAYGFNGRDQELSRIFSNANSGDAPVSIGERAQDLENYARKLEAELVGLERELLQ